MLIRVKLVDFESEIFDSYFFWKTKKDSNQFMCVRDMYHNVESKYCNKIGLEDLKILEEAQTTDSSTDELDIKSDIQFLKSSW